MAVLRWIWVQMATVIFRMIAGAILAAVCLLLGFSPDAWFAAVFKDPPEWLLSPITRLIVVLIGVITIGAFVAIHLIVTNRRTVVSKKTVPFLLFRDRAAKAGWHVGMNSVPIGDNEPLHFLQKLRQAAADGSVAFFGRAIGSYTGSLAYDSTPLIPIPADHFRSFELSPWHVSGSDNSTVKTVRDIHPHEDEGGFRDLHVNEYQAKVWLVADGAPSEPATFSINHKSSDATIGEYRCISALEVVNIGTRDLGQCLVQIEQVKGIGGWKALRRVLRTEGQISGNRTGRFSLSTGQAKIVPILFEHQDGSSWMLFDENGGGTAFPGLPVELLVGVYGGQTNGRLHVRIERMLDFVTAHVDSKPVNFTFPEAS